MTKVEIMRIFKDLKDIEMLKINNGDIKREIIWISKYHQEPRMQTLALNTLEKLATKKSANISR